MKKISIVLFLFILFLTFLGIQQLNAPLPASTTIPLVEFSSGRAMKHLKVIAQKPHPIGSSEQTKVCDYIFQELTAMGLKPEAPKKTVVNPRYGNPFLAGSVQNIIVKIEGTENNTKAVLLVAHYDSVPNGSGASDDGIGVAAILETFRSLKVGHPLKNDVVLLFSDGEEPGLLGAKAFVDKHPWAKEIGAVLNFEARGTGGPSILFETSNNNGRLIQEFAKASPHPIANSLLYSIYKILPNDTDLTIFKEAGFPGLNFAFIDGLIHYHTQSDNLANVSDRSLQHHGENMLALTRSLGNLDLSKIQEPDKIYFNLINPVFIQYPEQWVIPLSILVVILFSGVVGLGLKENQLTLRGVSVGFGLLLLSVISAAIGVTLIWWFIITIHGEYQQIPQGDTYNSSLYTIAFVSFSIALTSTWYIRLQSQNNIQNLSLGAMLWWLILMVLTSLLLPGASYLFTWPLFFSLIGQGILLLDRGHKISIIQRAAILLTCAIPSILLLVPTIYLISIALTVSLSGVVAALVVLLMGLLIPHLALIAIPNRWLLPRAAFCLSLIMLLSGSFTAGFDAKHPKPNSLFYGLNSDTGKAVWASANAQTDTWTSHYLDNKALPSKLDDFLPAVTRKFLNSPAPVVPLTPPKIETLSDTIQKDVRFINLQITSPRSARVMCFL